MGVLIASIGRWLTFDALKAIGWAIIGTAVIGFAITLYRDIKTSGATQAILQCQQAVAEGNSQAAAHLDAINARALQAASSERDKAKRYADEKEARIIALEDSLRSQSENPVCWPKDVARSLRK